MAAEAEAEEPPSDDLRCRRSDGRGWRCKRPALDGFPNCETHLSKAQRRRFLSGDPAESPRCGRPKRPTDSPPLDLVSITNVLPINKKKRLPRVPITEGNLASRVLPNAPVMGPPQDRILTMDRVVSSCDPPTRMTVKEETEDCPLEVEVTHAAEDLKESVRDSGYSQDVPDDHRCHRTDGKRWRCRRQAMEDHYYCELHRIQAYRRQYKLGVPEALKLKRGRVPVMKKEKVDIIRRKRKREEVGDGLEEVRKKRQTGMEKPVAALVRRVMRRRKKEKKDDKPDPMRNLHTVKNMESVPEHLRCRRTDGKRWRCSRRVLDNLSFCEIHHIQAYRRQYKLGVPESLKLKRGPRGSSVHPGMSRMPITHPRLSNWVLRKHKEDMNEDELRRAAKMEKRRKENETLLMDVTRMVLQRQMEKRRDQKRREEEAGVTRGVVKKVLPNGLMSISPPIPGSADLMGEHLDRKIMQDSSSFLRWCFRSKNVDTPPAGSLQVLPYARKAVGSGKRRRRVCHHCRTSPAGRILRCSRCRKASFCRSCIKKWYSEFSESDVRLSCPVCRGKCCCEVCTSTKPKDQSP